MLDMAFGEWGEAELQLGLVITLTTVACAIAFKVIPTLSHALFDRLQFSAAIYRDVIEPNQTLLSAAVALSVADVLIDYFFSNAQLYS
ncbi:MAG: hypothetical protein WBA01_01450, partial [Phormidesmis sp.]